MAVGTHGDVLPFIALGAEMARRGHGVALAAPAPFEPLARRAGLPFQALGTAADYEAMIRAPDLWHPRRGVRPLFHYVSSLTETTLLWLGASWSRGVAGWSSPRRWRWGHGWPRISTTCRWRRCR